MPDVMSYSYLEEILMFQPNIALMNQRHQSSFDTLVKLKI